MQHHVDNYTKHYIQNEKLKQTAKEIRLQMKESEEAIKVYMKDNNVQEIPIKINDRISFKITMKQKLELVKDKNSIS